MNAKEMFARNKRLKHMQALIANKERTLEESNALVDILVESITLQGGAVLELRQRQAVQQGAIEALANMVGAEQDNGTSLVGFDKPKLEIN